jgi:hypothetical protein
MLNLTLPAGPTRQALHALEGKKQKGQKAQHQQKAACQAYPVKTGRK